MNALRRFWDGAISWRQLGVRANADTPEDARRAHRFGAQGIGLCRTEHMFMAPDRQPLMRAMIMAQDDAGRRAALDQLLPLQQRDFEGLFAEMAGLVVTIRLLDPPLHEFLPDRFELHEEIVRARMRAEPPAGRARASARADAQPRGDQPDARDAWRAPRRAAPRDL